MVLARQRLGRNLQLPLQELNVCSTYSPFTTGFLKPQVQDVGDYSDLEKLCVIGHGNYGVVHKVFHRKTSAIYALKIIQEDININRENSCTSHEIEILTRTDSPYIIKCHGIFEPKVGEKAILMEYMEAGTLDTVVKKIGPLPETLIAHIAKQVLSGLSYLQESNIVHLDIKPSNLLVNKEMKVKIGDFGVSRIMGVKGCENSGSSQGTYAYMSPERLDSETFGSGYVYAGDVWSLGVSLWEIFAGYHPFFAPEKKPSWVEIVLAICHEEFPSLPNHASEEFVNFLMCCLERDPSKRWSVPQLLQHPFVCSLHAKDTLQTHCLDKENCQINDEFRVIVY